MGPTASGKTAAAILLAKHFNTEIISADSRQCFKELNIGVARPTPEELKTVPHHFIATHSIHQEVSAALFEEYAMRKAKKIFQLHDVVILVGGTGLYIKAFCEGLDYIPAVNPVIRERIAGEYQKKGIEWLQNEIKEKDKTFYTSGETNNPQRMMRALEVMEGTGQSILSFRKGKKTERFFNIIKLGLTLPREKLYQRINNRVDTMIASGLIDEAGSLKEFQHVNALQTVGYSELYEHFDGKLTLKTAIEKIKTNTRHYAKRQLTWFNKDASIHWVDAGDTNEMISFCEKKLGSKIYNG